MSLTTLGMICALLVGVLLTAIGLVWADVIDFVTAGVTAAVLNALGAGLAAALLFRAARRHEGRQRRVWGLLAMGTGLWCAGVVPSAVYFASSGSYAAPPWWTQTGYLLAYVPWVAALWLLSQRVVAESRRRMWETLGIEIASFALLSTVVLAALWNPKTDVAGNVAMLVPVALDLLLIAATYHAVRRASFHWASTYPWLVAGYLTMAAADIAMGYTINRGATDAPLLLLPMGMYCVAFALLGAAADRPLELRESALAGDRVTVALAALSLAVAGPAATMAPGEVAPVAWGLAAIVAWRLHAVLRRQDRSDEDPITGLHDGRAFNRHLAGILAGASEAQPVALVAVDLRGFATWNAVNGFSAGDAVLAEVAELCVRAAIGPGLWGRIGADRFCWVGRVADADQGRMWTEAALLASERNSAGIPARAALVVCPADATTAANAQAALEEALDAAAHTNRRLVAFDRGLMDGAVLDGSYSASFRSRRDRVTEVIADPTAVRTVFQPIVRLSSLAVVGHEALSRVERQPYRSPDQWINEAHQVGLGLELESACVQRGTAGAPVRPRGTYLSVNASPHLVMSGLLDAALPDGDLSWLVIEITEHERVRDYGLLAARLAGPRHRGALVAVDDVGAGHSTLRHVMRLSPDFAKLDRSMVQGVDSDPAKQALMRSMVAFSREMACTLVAEGIETLPELETLRDLGVRFGQGYLFRRPAADMASTLISVAPGVHPRRMPDDEPALHLLPERLRRAG